MRKIIEKCPSCGHDELVITTVSCPECGTQVRGAFVASSFCRLSEPSLQFLETFVRNRGNLKEMERELNIAYTTLRNRLNEVIQEMGHDTDDEDEDHGDAADSVDEERLARRREILDRLKNGELSADEAIRAMQEA